MTVYRDLIDCETLRGKLDDPDWRVVDCRFALDDPAAGRRQWRESHVPGAVYADLERDLSGPVGPGTGRHPLPGRDELTELFNALGIFNEDQVVAYDDSGGVFAARFWWLAGWLGHDKVAVLDGGWQEWTDQGLAVSDSPPRPARGCFVAHPPLHRVVSSSEIEAAAGTGRLRLLDARAPERFRGDEEPIDAVAGHIPSAINLPFAGNLDARGRFRPAGELQQRLAGGDSALDVHYCGSGVTACHNILAATIAGLDSGCLYPGSWSEWISKPGREVERGEARE